MYELKIRDNLNLKDFKKLEELGFEKHYNRNSGKIDKFIYKKYQEIFIDLKRYKLDFECYSDELDIDIYETIIYDLTKEGFLIKVEAD